MLEVTIRGFQSLEDIRFRMDRFTVLVGRSNIGKSAIVRALKAALTNATGTDFVRHGAGCSRVIRGSKKCQCQCSVRLKNETLDLLWEKGDNVNRYTYNGQVFDSVDRGTPEFLLNDFSQVKIGEDKTLLQVADQFEPIFLLNRSGTVVADVLSDVAKLDDINAATRLVEKDRREAASTRKVREQDVQALSQKLDLYAGLDEAVDRSRATEKAYLAVKKSLVQVSQLEKFCVRLQDSATVVRALRKIDTVPDIDDERARQPVAAYLALLGYIRKSEERRAAIDELSPVEDIEFEADFPKASLEALLQMEHWIAQAASFKGIPARLKAVAGLADPDESRLKTDGYDAIRRWQKKTQVLDQEIARLEAEVSAAEDGEQKILAEWAELGVCPTCSQSVVGHELCLE